MCRCGLGYFFAFSEGVYPRSRDQLCETVGVLVPQEWAVGPQGKALCRVVMMKNPYAAILYRSIKGQRFGPMGFFNRTARSKSFVLKHYQSNWA